MIQVSITYSWEPRAVSRLALYHFDVTCHNYYVNWFSLWNVRNQSVAIYLYIHVTIFASVQLMVDGPCQMVVICFGRISEQSTERRISDFVQLGFFRNKMSESLFKHSRVIPHKEAPSLKSIVLLSDNCDKVSIIFILRPSTTDIRSTGPVKSPDWIPT